MRWLALLASLVGTRAFAAEVRDGGAAAETAPVAEPAAVEAVTPAETGGAGLFEQSNAAASGPAAPSLGGLQLNGYMRGAVYEGKVPGERDADLKAAYGELALQARTAKSPNGDGFAEARFRYGRMGDQQQTTVDIREAYVNAYLGPVDLRLGKQIVVWGRADILNPTNNITPNDLRIRSPIEDDRRLGNVGARGFLRVAPFRLEGVWMPFYVPSELPQVFLPQFVSFGSPIYPQPRVRDGLAAARLHLELPSIEMSVSYLVGAAPLPGLTLTSLTFDVENPSVVVARTAYRHQVVGFDFSTAIGDWIALRGEAAYRRPFDHANKIEAARPDLQYALGADHNFGQVSVIVQYLGRYVFDWRKEAGPASELNPDVLRMTPEEGRSYREQFTSAINSQLANLNQILFSQTAQVQHLASARVEWLTLHDTLSLSMIGLYNVTTREWMAAPKLGYRLSDTMTAYLGAEVLTGPKGTLFGIVDQTLSAGYAELRATF